MKKTPTFLLVGLACCFSQSALSKASINDMQTCQGLLDFLEIKLDDAPSHYPADKVTKISKGLNQYNNYIQEEIVSPGLLEFNGGNASKADAMQLQVDAYKATIVKSFIARNKTSSLTTDYAISVNNCAKKAVPSGEALESLKYAINTLIELAQIKP